MMLWKHSLHLTCAILALGMLHAFPASAQDCSRNMLKIGGPGSYVATPDVPALHLTKGFTIECWVRPDQYSSPAAVVDKSGAQFGYGLFLDTSSTIYGVIRKTNAVRLYSPSIDFQQSWHHVAFVCKPGDSLYLYVDSSEVASAGIHSITSIDFSADSLRVGISSNGSSFSGDIDELRVWNTPRPLTAIKSTLFKTLPPNDSTLVLYYTFDDEAGSNSRIHDFSGHGHDGYMHGIFADIAPSTSPIVNGATGFRLSSVEQKITIPTKRCIPAFDTVIHLRNLGTTPLLVDTVGFTVGRAFSIVPSSPFTLQPGKVDSIRLHFEPRGSSNYVYDDEMYISGSDHCAGVIHIALHASYDSVGLQITPNVLSFGARTQCDSPAKREVSITNTSSTDPITIVSNTILGSMGLSLDKNFPLTLQPKSSVSVTVTLTSNAQGPSAASLALALDKCSRQASLTVTAIGKRAAFSLSSIVFPAAQSSLNGIVRDTIIVLTNSGDTGTRIGKITTDPENTLQIDPVSRPYLSPGDTVHLRAHLRASSCGIVKIKLKVETLVCASEASTEVSIDIIPPSSVTAAPLDLGVACSGEQRATLHVVNPNDYAVRLDDIGFAKKGVFILESPRDLQVPRLLPAQGSADILIRFVPPEDGDYTDTAYFQMSPCGTGMTTLHGTKGYQGLSFEGPLDFGRGCDPTPITKRLTLTNSSSREDTIFDNSFPAPSRFELEPFGVPFILKPGQSKTFNILYKPSLGTRDTATFTLLSREGCRMTSVKLSGSREIAKTAWSSPSLNFDTVCSGTTLDKVIDLTNLGIDSVDIVSSSISGNVFSVVSSPSAIGPKGSFTIRFEPSSAQSYAATLNLILDKCGTSISLPLMGSGGPLPSIIAVDHIDFHSVNVGDSSTVCIAVTNPSCTALQITADTKVLAGTSFYLTSTSPTVLARGDTAYYCVTFRPNQYGELSAVLTFASDSALPRMIQLRGTGRAPDVRLTEHILDFGYVLVGDLQSMSVHVSNLGNAPAAISLSHQEPSFGAPTLQQIGESTADSIRVTFHPTTVGYFSDTLHLVWNGRNDSVILRGQGTQKGLLLSSVGLDFGYVHVHHDSLRELYLFARKDFPTIDSIRISGPFSVRTDPMIPHAIADENDQVIVSVTYHASLEQQDQGALTIFTGSDSTVVDLDGRGVEAHPRLNPTDINFGEVNIGDTTLNLQIFRIKNDGGYPLFVAPMAHDPVFIITPTDSSVLIMPGLERQYYVNFRPTRARYVAYLLPIQTSSPDSVSPLLLRGKGVYPAGKGPSFGFDVASASIAPGDRFSLPVSIYGSSLEKIDADSMTLAIRYDPTMLRLRTPSGATAESIDDSTITYSVPMKRFAEGPIFSLNCEALLGTHPVSYVQVISSEPSSNRSALSDIGTITTSDCDGSLHGVVIAGGYNTNNVSPNPSGDHTTIEYTLGLDGVTTVDIYNLVGTIVKHIDRGVEKAGDHTVQLDLSDLPAGRYVYRLKSLEYQAEGSFVRVR